MIDTTSAPGFSGGCARRIARAAPRAGAHRRRCGRHRITGRRDPRARACAAERLAAERQAAVRALRPARSPASVVAALVLVTAGAVALAETLLVVAERAPRLVAFERMTLWAESTTWRDPAALGTAAAATALGVLLVLAAVLPGRPRLVPLRTGDPDLILGVSRQVLAALVADAVARAAGVHRVRVRVRRRRLVVVASAEPGDAGAAAERVRRTAERELARLDPLIALRVRPRIRVAAAGRDGAGAR